MDPDPPSVLLMFLDVAFIFPLLGLILLLFVSGLVSGSEVAFFSISPNEMDELKKVKLKSDHQVLKLLKEPNKLLGTILISNNFVNIAIIILSSIIMTPILSLLAKDIATPIISLGSSEIAFILQLVMVTFVILLFGEILPKIYATKNGLILARFMAGPLTVISKMVRPLNKLLTASSRWIKPAGSDKISVTDLEHALDLTEDNNRDDDEQKILRGIVKFGSITARQIMTPRPDVVAIDRKESYEDLMKLVQESGFSRIPIFEDTIDQIKGTLYIKDLLPFIDESSNFNWNKLIRDPFFIPENKKIDDLLKEFQEKKIHIAIVVDEFGGTSGIISLEDVLEEIVGEISDEFDEENLVYSKLDDRNYIFEGKTSIPEFCKVLHIDETQFEEAKGDTESLAGLLLEISGKFPIKGEVIEFENFKFQIESVNERRIQHVKVTLL